MTDSLLHQLGLELPVIQAPMAGAQGSALAIAVSEAGGLGSLPCAMLDFDTMRAELHAISSATTRPYNVNFFCHEQPSYDAEADRRWREVLAPFYDALGLNTARPLTVSTRHPFSAEAVELLEEFRPAVVSFHFGLPSGELLQRVKRLGCFTLSTATTKAEALWLQARGVDAIIAQGIEAGGHRGSFIANGLTDQLPTVELLSEILDTVSVPVIAAGGISCNAAVKRSMLAGAAAVQVGTAYLLCPEATTTGVHRQMLKGSAKRATALTNLFTGRPARGIINRLMKEIGPVSPHVPKFPLAATALAPLREAAERKGMSDYSPLWCGDNDDRLEELPAGELTRKLASG